MTAQRPGIKGIKVRVYRNLRRPGWFSIVADAGPPRGKVIGYARSVCLSCVVFKVSQSGRERTVASGRKRVHAWAIGWLVFASDELITVPHGFRPATYRPFHSAVFFDLESGAAIQAAASAILARSLVFYRP